MAITTAPDRSGHPAGHSQPIVIAVLIAALALAVFGVAVLVHGGSSHPGVQGSGAAVNQARAVASFTGLELAGSTNATVIVGGPQSVAVHADSNLVNHVTTGVVAGTLVIGDTGGFTTR